MLACAIGPAAETPPPAWQRRSRQYEVLVRHFFSRFVETDGTANIGPVIGIVATPGALLSILLQPLSVLGWGLVQFRYFCIAYSMVVVALLVVYRWDLLFPDRADYQILTPLPVRSSTLFITRLLAFGMLLAVVLVAANALATAMWPGIDRQGSWWHCLATHAVVTSAAGLFAGFSAAAVQGLLLNALPVGLFRRVSPIADHCDRSADRALVRDADSVSGHQASLVSGQSVARTASGVLVRRPVRTTPPGH